MTLHYTLATVNEPGSQFTFLNGINDFGQVTGFGTTAFVEQNDHFNTLNIKVGPYEGEPTALNNVGEIVGAAYSNDEQMLAFEGRAGAFRMLSPPYPGSPQPNAVNDFGAIVGYSGNENGDPGPSTGWLDVDGRFSAIEDPGASITDPTGINDFGVIVGTVGGPGLEGHGGFIDDHGVFSSIAVPGAYTTWPAAINNFGEVVGTTSGPDGIVGFAELGGRYDTFQVPNAQDVEVTSVNDFGQIAGFSLNGLFTSQISADGFVATPDLASLITPAALGLASKPEFLLPVISDDHVSGLASLLRRFGL